MNSPFPGMDPYLESRWSDVHATLVGYIKEALQPQLPRDLRARSEERVLVEEEEAEKPRYYESDIAVIDLGRKADRYASSGSSAATIEPVVIRHYEGPTVDRFVQIIDVHNGNRVVTAIEILSPWNKCSGRLNRDYLRKLDDYIAADVSVVEIDLLRDPLRGHLRVTEADIPPERRTPYQSVAEVVFSVSTMQNSSKTEMAFRSLGTFATGCYLVCVRKAWRSHEWLAYPIRLRDRLPVIPVPLRQKDAEVGLDLQPLIERVYVAGGHDDIDYTKPPDPSLKGEDATWANELLKTAGKR